MVEAESNKLQMVTAPGGCVIYFAESRPSKATPANTYLDAGKPLELLHAKRAFRKGVRGVIMCL